AEQFRVREHDAGVDDNRRLAPGKREHVHAELAESAERNDFEHSRGSADHREDALGRAIPGGESRDSARVRQLGAPATNGGGRVVPLKPSGTTTYGETIAQLAL